MRDECDFTDAQQGRFYRPIEELDIPIYLDQEIKEYFMKNLKNKTESFSLSEVINSLLKKDIEITQKMRVLG